MSDYEKRKNLENFLLARYPNKHELINEVIISHADIIGYDKDSFTYEQEVQGGKRRKTSKRRKPRNQRKTSKQRK